MINIKNIGILLLALVIAGVVIYAKPEQPEPIGAVANKYELDVSKNPYHSWTNVQTGEKKYFDKNGKRYTNTLEITNSQKQIISEMQFINSTST